MPYSGDKTWRLSRDQIINSALKKIGSYDSSEDIPMSERSDAATALNAIMKEMVGQGLGLWLRYRSILILEKGKQRYSLGPNGDNFFPDSELRECVLSADAAAADPVLNVTGWQKYDGSAVTSNADYPGLGARFGVRLDDGGISWGQMFSSTASVINDITLSLSGAASSGNRVYAYEGDKSPRPYRILTLSRQNTSGIYNEMELIGRTDYESLSAKNAYGSANQAHYDPKIDDGVLYVWPAKNGADLDKLVITYHAYPDDIDLASQNPQFPLEWYNALIFRLAHELSFEYGVERNTRREIKAVADEKFVILRDSSDRENADVSFEMDIR